MMMAFWLTCYSVWFVVERQNAPWLPRWRRYMGVWLSMMGKLLCLREPGLGNWLTLVALLVYFWNCISAEINRGNRKNYHKLEAAASHEMTTVQRQQWAGQLQEAS